MTAVFIAFCLLAPDAELMGGQEPIGVVPIPRVVRPLGGSFRFLPSRIVVRLALRDSAAVVPVLEEIDATSHQLFGAAPARGRTGGLTLWAGVPGNDPAFDRACRAHQIAPGDSLGEEGYILRVTRNSIVVAARSSRGVFYGLQTLVQLIRGAATRDGSIPALHIVDWPVLRVRAVMDDISRGPVPTGAYIREQIRRCAELKINALTYYTEHVVLTRSHPDFAPPGGALSIDEWKELANYARRYFIDLLGNFQSFGHFDKILAKPAYHHLGERGSLLSPVQEESYSFLADIYGELVPAFKGPLFHVNCDETFDLGKGASKVLVDSLGAGRVYLGHVLRLREILRRLGARMMIWGDVLLEHPEVIDLVPRDVVIATWTYDTLADYHRFILPFRSHGFDVLVSPGILNSHSIVPDFRQTFVNTQRFLRDGAADGVTGAMTTVWDDGGTALFSQDWYGVAYAAERMWNSTTRDTTYRRRFDLALYGDRAHASSRGIECLLDLAGLFPTDGMNARFLRSPVLPAAGYELPLNLTDWDRVLVTATRSDSLFGLGRPLTWHGDLDALRFAARLYETEARLRLSLNVASHKYRHAISESGHDRGASRSDLVTLLDLLALRRREFSALRDQYTSLWLTENHLYALDTIETWYDRRIRDLSDVEQRVRTALKSFEMGAPLPSALDVRLAIVESAGSSLLDWLVAGPINANCLDADYLAATGGEASASPAVTQEFSWEGRTYRWKRLAATGPLGVDLPAEGPDSVQGTWYAFATIESPDTRSVRAYVGATDDICMVLNGTRVFEARRAQMAERASIVLSLGPGKNQMLIKICSGGRGASGFSLWLPDSQVRNRKNRYRIVH